MEPSASDEAQPSYERSPENTPPQTHSPRITDISHNEQTQTERAGNDTSVSGQEGSARNQGWLISNLLVVVILTVTFSIGLSQLVQVQGFTDLAYMRGFVILPAALVALTVTAVAALARPELLLAVLPSPVNDLLKPVEGVKAGLPAKSVWIGLIVAAVSALTLSYMFPRCVEPGDVLVSFSEIHTPEVILLTTQSMESVPLPASTTYWLTPYIIHNGKPASSPQITCEWTRAGDGVFLGGTLTATECSVQYTTGQDNLDDVISLQMKQQRCDSLPQFAFFVQRSP